MSIDSSQSLLKKWEALIETAKEQSEIKAGKDGSGLEDRIRRTTGPLIIFDSDTHENQQKLQALLCDKLPQFTNLIKSVPPIMDGYSWTRGDFIELYFEHYKLVIHKLRQLIDQKEQDNK